MDTLKDIEIEDGPLNPPNGKNSGERNIGHPLKRWGDDTAHVVEKDWKKLDKDKES